MQTLQLLGGAAGRAAFLRCALAHLEPGGRVAAAVADALACFDEDHPTAPPPEALELDGVLYSTQLLAVAEERGCAVLYRRRQIIGPGERCESQTVSLRMDRVSAAEIAAEARSRGFLSESPRRVPETEQYLGSTVAILRAP
jgi:hypothetical protein